jgi:hypothetical protein
MLDFVSTLDLALLWGVLNACDDVLLFVRMLLDLASADAREEWAERDFLDKEVALFFVSGLETECFEE